MLVTLRSTANASLCLASLSCSCPGPKLVSTAFISTLALTTRSHYSPNMNCSVTVYSPDGGGVSVTFVAFSTEPEYDCRFSAVPEYANFARKGQAFAIMATMAMKLFVWPSTLYSLLLWGFAACRCYG